MDIRARLRRWGKRWHTMRRERDELIREATEAGMSRRAIAEDLGVSFSLVQKVVEKSASGAES